MPRKRPIAQLSVAQTTDALPVTTVKTEPVRNMIKRTVELKDGVLSLPAVETVGKPVRIDVPGIGAVDVPAREYSSLLELLGSGDLAKQVQAQQLLSLIMDSAVLAKATGLQSLSIILSPDHNSGLVESNWITGAWSE